ncbi:hypothetical protein DY000_02031763 [Brassica cretica]|uniref:Uncharacterized protein n=1 Tax=Brassica cretica TaxID=69181 RepID=A0ABQ7DS72_BRACR|nr:hypothetical protein DY000_02031763 [Brassica cretica]
MMISVSNRRPRTSKKTETEKHDKSLKDHPGSHQPGLHVPVSNITKLFSENVIRSEEEKSVVVLDERGEKSFEKNQSFSTGERVSSNDKNLDQDFFQPKNEINPSLVVDWDSETGREEPYRYIMPKDEVEESGLKAVNKHLKMQRSWLSMGN